MFWILGVNFLGGQEILVQKNIYIYIVKEENPKN